MLQKAKKFHYSYDQNYNDETLWSKKVNLYMNVKNIERIAKTNNVAYIKNYGGND